MERTQGGRITRIVAAGLNRAGTSAEAISRPRGQELSLLAGVWLVLAKVLLVRTEPRGVMFDEMRRFVSLLAVATPWWARR